MSSNNLKKTTTSNFLWRLAERFSAQGVTFVVSIILARLLEPKDYEPLTLVTIFITIMQVFVDSGMGSALIQKKNADDLDFSTVFYFNIAMCSVLYLTMFFTAPLIAAFYEMPDLIPIIRVVSVSLIFSAVRNVQQAYISRNMMFKKFFLVTLGGTIGAAIVGITMAYNGFGVWALVTQQIFNSFISVIILWSTVKWRPKLQFSFFRLKTLFSFGWKLLLSGLIDTLYNDLRQLIIGKKYSTEDLVFYTKGSNFPKIIVVNINSSIDSVLLPLMSKEQDNRNRVKAMTRRAIRVGSYCIAPMMIGMFVCAEPFVKVLLTEKWLGCVFYLRIFCITYMFYPIHTANLNAINAMGRSDYFLKLEIVKKIVGLTLVFTTMWISVEAMAYSMLISVIMSTIINSYPNKKLLNYSWFEQMKDILPNILLAVVMGVPVYFISFLPLPDIAVLAIQVVTGAIIYIGISAIFKLEIFMYLWNIVKGFLEKRKKS